MLAHLGVFCLDELYAEELRALCYVYEEEATICGMPFSVKIPLGQHDNVVIPAHSSTI